MTIAAITPPRGRSHIHDILKHDCRREALRHKLGYEQWAVLGHSSGGNVALEYALRYSHSLSYLILMDIDGDHWWVKQNVAEILRKRGYSTDAVQAAHRFYNGHLTPDEYYSLFIKFMSAYYYRFSYLMLGKDIA